MLCICRQQIETESYFPQRRLSFSLEFYQYSSCIYKNLKTITMNEYGKPNQMLVILELLQLRDSAYLIHLYRIIIITLCNNSYYPYNIIVHHKRAAKAQFSFVGMILLNNRIVISIHGFPTNVKNVGTVKRSVALYILQAQ